MSFRRKSLWDRMFLRGRVWWFHGYDAAGKRYPATTHQTERRTAFEAAKKIESERAVPTDSTQRKAQALTLEGALTELHKHDLRIGAKPKTIEFHNTRSRHLIRVLGRDRLVAPLTRADLNAYTDQRLAEVGGELPQRHTIAMDVRVLITALNVCKENDLYFGDPGKLKPAAFRKSRQYYKRGDRWLERAEYCQALIDATSSDPQTRYDRKLHVLAYLHLGVRRSELFTILPEHVNLSAKTVWIDGTKTDGAARTVTLSDTACTVMALKLKDTKPGQPLFEKWDKVHRDLTTAWKRARKALIASAPDATERERLAVTLPTALTTNDLRRTFCSLMAAAGVPLHHCADLLGHKSLDMVMQVYRKVSPAALHEAVAKLPALQIETVSVAVTTQLPGSHVDAHAARSRRKLSA